MNSLNIDFVCAVLKESKLIDDRLVQEIKVHETTYRQLLQKDAAANGSTPITGVDVISSMGLNSLTDQVLSEELIMRTLASHWKLPFLKIDLAKLDPSMVTSRVSEPFAKEHLTIPVSISENMLFIALVNPLDDEALETMKRVSTLKVRPVISTKTDILDAIEKCYGTQEAVNTEEKDLFISSPSPSTEREHTSFLAVDNDQYADKNIVNAVNLLLHYAFEQRTSEIHIDPKQHHSAIYFRIDGMLYDVKSIPLELHTNILLRLKALAGIDISERHKPQDGQTHFEFRDRDIHLRISTMPVAFGEKVVLRILDPLVLFRHIDDLGFSPEELKQYMTFISRFGGIILITGPAASGKTTTLYSTLNQLVERGINITTVEDPIESIHEGFDQISVLPHMGMTFETAIQHIVRQSPGVLMVGEMRDEKAVEQTVQAALAGHLVLSTLHTHDTASAIVQLVDMGIQPFLVGSTVIAVIAQRLVRKVCDSCARSTRLSSQEIDELHLSKEEAEKLSLRKGTGCITCRGTGYFGQIGIFEIMEITDEVRSFINNNAGAYAIKNAAAKQGMRPLRRKAIETMKAGITTCEEVLRITGGLKGRIAHKFKSKILLDSD
jgi:general secretion pathway protein E